MSRSVIFRPLRAGLGVWAACVAVLSLWGCASDNAPERPVVTVTIPPQEWLLNRIAGDRIEVGCILSSGSDPESFEPSMRQLASVERSQAYFSLGGLPFEEAFLEQLRENYPALRIVDTSEGITRIADACHGHGHHDHDHGHHDHDHGATGHDDFDPHLWTSVRNARIMAANMHRALLEIDSAGKPVYDANLMRLDSVLCDADRRIVGLLEGIHNRTFLTWHPSLGYFAADYGLRQMSVQQEGKEVSPRRLAEAIDEVRRVRPAVLFYEESAAGSGTEMLGADFGLTAVPLRLMDPDFIPQLIGAARALRNNQ